MILFYGKSDAATWREARRPLSEEQVAQRRLGSSAGERGAIAEYETLVQRGGSDELHATTHPILQPVNARPHRKPEQLRFAA